MRVFPITGCEPHWGDDPQAVAEIFLEGTPRLFAALEVAWPFGDDVTTDTALVYEWDRGRPGSVYTLFLHEGEVVGVDTGCGLAPEDRLDSGWGYGDYTVILRGPAYR